MAVSVATPLRLGGERRSGTRAIDVVSPIDGGVVGRVALASASEFEEALERAHRAFGPLAQASPLARRKALEEAANALESRSAEIARTICEEAGKPIALAKTEVDRALATLRAAAEEAVRAPWGEVVPLETSRAGVGRRGQVRRFPRGVVAAITPFNFPLNLACHKVAPALACGCPVVLKPSERTPLTGHILGDAVALGLEAASLPPDAAHVLPALPADSGPLVQDPRVAVVSFTGGAATGWKLKEKASAKQVLLELGGDASAIVWSDADLAYAARKCAHAAFAYAGQICISLQHIFIQESVYERFLARFLEETRALGVGDPRDPKTIVGPLIDDAAVERVEAWIEEARARGARVLLEGPRRGRVIPPVVIERVPPDTKLGSEEAFGPVVTVEPVPRFEEALARASRSRYGLQAGLFTRDVRRIEAAFERLEVGTLVVGDAPNWRVDTMPYGGVKASGFGREGLRYAIEAFTEPRLLVLTPEEKPDLDAGGTP
jgi:acyl-CoA reductase-like NAD-dependent aldehyde dehydrogenase